MSASQPLLDKVPTRCCGLLASGWVFRMQHDGGVGHRESIVLDIHLVRCGQLRVVEYLILAARHVSYAVLHLLSRSFDHYGEGSVSCVRNIHGEGALRPDDHGADV